MKKLVTILVVILSLASFQKLVAQDVINLGVNDSIASTIKSYTGTSTELIIVVPRGYTNPEFAAAKSIVLDTLILHKFVQKVTIKGDGSNPRLLVKQFVLPQRALNSFTAQGLTISGVDETTSTSPYSLTGYLFNCSSAAINVTNLNIIGCSVADYRGVVRLQTTGLTVSNLKFDNCVVRNIGYAASSYNIVNAAAGTIISNMTLTNSTFYAINGSFLSVSAAYSTVASVTIDKCTFDDILINTTGKYLLDLTASNTTTPVTITNSIFARAGASNKGVRGGVITSTNNYATTDWVASVTANMFTTTPYTGTYAALFKSPTTYDTTNQLTTVGNYAIADGAFPAGVGDPKGGTLTALTAPTVSSDIRFNGSEISVPEARTINVFNVTGLLLKSATNANRLSVSGLPIGIYIVKAGNAVQKIAIR